MALLGVELEATCRSPGNVGVAAGRLGRCWGGRDLPAPCIFDPRAFDVTRAMEEVGCLDTCQIAWRGKSPEEHALHVYDLTRYSPGPDLQLGAGLGWGWVCPNVTLAAGELGWRCWLVLDLLGFLCVVHRMH